MARQRTSCVGRYDPAIKITTVIVQIALPCGRRENEKVEGKILRYDERASTLGVLRRVFSEVCSPPFILARGLAASDSADFCLRKSRFFYNGRRRAFVPVSDASTKKSKTEI